MKILKFKLFEKEEYSDETKEGFKYSELEVKEFLQDLMDNCDLELKSIHSILTDEDFENIKGLSEATWCGFEILLYKEVHEDKKFIWRETDSYPRKLIYLNDSFDELSIYKELKDLSQRFEKFFHHLTVSSGGYFLKLVILDSVNDFEKEERIRVNKEYNSRSLIYNRFSSFRNQIKNSTRLSPVFRRAIFLNKVVESTNFQGSLEDGYLIQPINTSKLSKVVVKENLPKLEELINNNFILKDYLKWITKKELRIITEDDLKKVIEFKKRRYPDIKVTLQQLKERYEGIYGIIINFNYEDWFENLMNQN
jgi:hypothetical protein